MFLRQEVGMVQWRAMDIMYLVTVLGVILVSMMLHELMHGFIAFKLGDDTARLLGRLSFNPLKHVDPFMTIMLPMLIVITNGLTGASMPIFGGAKPVPFNPANIKNEWGVALIAAAGPLVNLVIAFISYASFFLLGSPQDLVGSILATSVQVNLGFFVFNIIPFPPLDGSRVLYVLAPDFARKIMDMIERYGTFFVLMVVLLFNNVLMVYMTTVINGILDAFSHIISIS